MAETTVQVTLQLPLKLTTWLADMAADTHTTVPRLAASMLAEIRRDTEESEGKS